MFKIILFSLLALFLGGCEIYRASNEQISTCVQTCKSINAKMTSGNQKYRDNTFYCQCSRDYIVNVHADGVKETTNE